MAVQALEISGATVDSSVSYAGGGAYAIAYRSETNPNIVYISAVVGDMAKDILCELQGKSPYIPYMEYLGYDDATSRRWYKTHYSSNCSGDEVSSEVHDKYSEIRRALGMQVDYHEGNLWMLEDRCKEIANTDSEMAIAVELIFKTAINHGYYVREDAHSGNFGYLNGQILLRDIVCVEDSETISDMDTIQENRRGNDDDMGEEYCECSNCLKERGENVSPSLKKESIATVKTAKHNDGCYCALCCQAAIRDQLVKQMLPYTPICGPNKPCSHCNSDLINPVKIERARVGAMVTYQFGNSAERDNAFADVLLVLGEMAMREAIDRTLRYIQ